MRVIDRFCGEYRFLSNFYPASVVLDGIEYATVEHAYQAAKVDDRALRLQVAAAATPGRAKRMGRKLPLRAAWEQVKVDVMRGLVRQKFTHHAELRTLLLATGTAELIEGNTWNDTFWGVCRGAGRNELGRILMDVRRELAGEPAAAGVVVWAPPMVACDALG